MNLNENLRGHFWDTIIQCPQAFSDPSDLAPRKGPKKGQKNGSLKVRLRYDFLGPTRLKFCRDIKGGLNMPHNDTFGMGWP